MNAISSGVTSSGMFGAKPPNALKFRCSTHVPGKPTMGLWTTRTGEVVVKALPKGNSQHTITFLKALLKQSPHQRLLLFWDGAKYHRSEAVRAFLEQINGDKPEAQWRIRCICFAPYAPEQNPIEDIWLQAKTYLRQHYYRCETFAQVKQMFVKFLQDSVFDFPKLYRYG